MLMDSSMLTRHWVRIVPHIIDTVLLLSALTLAILVQQYPFVHAWLTAKVIALLIYILLGTVALKRGKTKAIRAIAFCAAVITFAYIVLVALNHDPMPSLLLAQ